MVLNWLNGPMLGLYSGPRPRVCQGGSFSGQICAASNKIEAEPGAAQALFTGDVGTLTDQLFNPNQVKTPNV